MKTKNSFTVPYRKIVVTGGAGFLGGFVVSELRKHPNVTVSAPRRADYDLTREPDVLKLLRDERPDLIIHLAAAVGGIGANKANPGKFFYDNLMMGAMLMEQARLGGVAKFVAVGTICSYPKLAPVPFREEDLWDGYPELITAPYGLAKKMLLVQSQSYRQQYGFNSIYLMPTNLYGENDNFDLESSHVVPALIRKCVAAKMNGDEFVEVWGTGSATREFLYAGDAAAAIVRAAALYNESEPINIGTGSETKISDLVELIAELIGFAGEIRWNTEKPDGQPRRCLDVTKARAKFGFAAETPLAEGLRRTINWYLRESEKTAAL